MKVDEIKNILASNMQYMHSQFGLCSIAIFGSTVTGNTMPESDIDLLVELIEPDYSKYIGLQLFLEKKLHKKVDLIRKGPHLSKSFLGSIEDQLVYA